MEVKSVVLYPQASPSGRSMVADIKEAKDFLPLMAGLLRRGNVRQQDTVVGVSDGASWLAVSSLDIPHVIDPVKLDERRLSQQLLGHGHDGLGLVRTRAAARAA